MFRLSCMAIFAILSVVPLAAAIAQNAAPETAPQAPTTSPRAPIVTQNAFNPAISLILDGKYRNLELDPDDYAIGGFVPAGGHGDEGHGHGAGPGERGFSIDESELTISANIDPYFSGYFTAAIVDEEVEVEEAFIQNTGFLPGTTVKFGRFFSAFGYQNEQHPHAWDFVDAPLVHQAFFGGNLAEDGLQARWVAPTPIFLEFGLEGGRGANFPGAESEKNGLNAGAVFVHVGGDVGINNSYRVGASYRKTRAAEREYDDTNSLDEEVENVFSDVESSMWGIDVVWKWAMNGDPSTRHFKFQAEYFHRKEDGNLQYDAGGGSTQGTLDGNFSTKQTGFYVQGVYQFMPRWRFGVRFDQLDSGSFNSDLFDAGLTRDDFQLLRDHKPKRNSAMIDFSPSEFSRFRLQFTEDQARFDASDSQIFLQYIMSLGAHGAHKF
ncbi:MAG: hypothetical protein ACKVP2_08895 [Burkholderiales bacterium]